MLHRFDNHNHILNSTVLDMVNAAKIKNIKEFSITEHISQFALPRKEVSFISFHAGDEGRIFKSFTDYRDEFHSIVPEKDIQIRMGLEVDYLPDFEKKLNQYVTESLPWDILLCSVHVCDGQDIENMAHTSNPEIMSTRWEKYIQLQKLSMESGFIQFDVLAHPVRLASSTTPPAHISDLLSDLVRTAKHYGIAIELNGGDLEIEGIGPALVNELAKICSKEGCAVSIGSDAHHPDEVFWQMDDALSLIDKYRLRTLAK